jgi:hypothetical protein
MDMCLPSSMTPVSGGSGSGRGGGGSGGGGVSGGGVVVVVVIRVGVVVKLVYKRIKDNNTAMFL